MELRSIKFRGKQKEGKWVYGLLFNDVFDCYFIEWIKEDKKGRKFSEYEQVIPETVGQLLFTNPYSESFYDGDIVDIGQTINGCSQFELKQGVYGIDIWYHDRTDLKYEYDVTEFLNMLMYNEFGEVKVIGNIHDIDG